jgi:glyoxylase-like metal-dependent hydrolase (beta-lactamase superfamily II)
VLRRVLRIAGWLLVAGVVVVGVVLGSAHLGIRGLGGPLPTDLGVLEGPDLPVSLSVVNTASQRVPRAQVLDAGRDPTPAAPYVLGHPAFLLRWADGRKLLIDAGMEREAARDFGAPLELVGADPLEAHGGVAEQLGDELAAGRLGVVFTHLHTDHTQGIGQICEARRGAEIELFQTPAQATRRNFTTRPGAAHLEAAGCLRGVVLPEAPLASLPGFGGVGVVWAAGHTPGSQVVLVALREPGGPRRIAFAGDVANTVDGIRFDVGKPLLYRLLLVPEDDARLGALRRFLGHLEQAGFAVVPSHDLLHLRSLGFAGPAGARERPD